MGMYAKLKKPYFVGDYFFPAGLTCLMVRVTSDNLITVLPCSALKKGDVLQEEPKGGEPGNIKSNFVFWNRDFTIEVHPMDLEYLCNG